MVRAHPDPFLELWRNPPPVLSAALTAPDIALMLGCAASTRLATLKLCSYKGAQHDRAANAERGARVNVQLSRVNKCAMAVLDQFDSAHSFVRI